MVNKTELNLKREQLLKRLEELRKSKLEHEKEDQKLIDDLIHEIKELEKEMSK